MATHLPALTLRRATPADAQALGFIHFHAWNLSAAGLLPEATLARRTLTFRQQYWEETLDAEAPPLGTTVGVSDGIIVGLVTVVPGSTAMTGELKHIYVHPDYMRNGIGALLMRAATDSLVQNGYRSGQLWVLDGNLAAQRFYESMGWDPTGAHDEIDVWQTDERLRVIEYRRRLI